MYEYSTAPVTGDNVCYLVVYLHSLYKSLLFTRLKYVHTVSRRRNLTAKAHTYIFYCTTYGPARKCGYFDFDICISEPELSY